MIPVQYQPTAAFQGTKLTTVRRMKKKKSPFPKEKAGVVGCHCDSERAARDTRSVPLLLLCWQRRDRDVRKMVGLFLVCIARNRYETVPVLTTNLKQGDKVWVKESFKKQTKKAAEMGEGAVGPLIMLQNCLLPFSCTNCIFPPVLPSFPSLLETVFLPGHFLWKDEEHFCSYGTAQVKVHLQKWITEW